MYQRIILNGFLLRVKYLIAYNQQVLDFFKRVPITTPVFVWTAPYLYVHCVTDLLLYKYGEDKGKHDPSLKQWSVLVSCDRPRNRRKSHLRELNGNLYIRVIIRSLINMSLHRENGRAVQNTSYSNHWAISYFVITNVSSSAITIIPATY